MRRRAQLVAILLAALSLAACGDETTGEGSQAVPDEPAQTGTAPAATSPPTAPEREAEPPAGEADGPGGGEDVPGGGTDANALVPAVFELGPEATLSPRTIGVPEFLGIRLEVRSSDDQAHHVALLVDPPVEFTLPPGGSKSLDVMGQRAGRFALMVDGERAGTLEVGVEPGP